jgi:hypothetical protein
MQGPKTKSYQKTPQRSPFLAGGDLILCLLTPFGHKKAALSWAVLSIVMVELPGTAPGSER